MTQSKIKADSFAYVEKEDAEVYAINIKKGRFKGVIFSFGKVDLKEDKENDQLALNFRFVVQEGNTRYGIDELNDSKKFKTYIADILKYILEEEFGEYDEHTAANIKENL
tara:strand:+ start:353 stop:682 length:330 start_codon:yes stop_codon:yes gene_type:complete